MSTNQHVSLADMNVYLGGYLDQIEFCRVQGHCHGCDACSCIRDLMIRGWRERGEKVVEEPSYMCNHFSHDTLRKYHRTDSDLTGEERALIANHLHGCEECLKTLRGVQSMEDITRRWEELGHSVDEFYTFG